MDVQPVFVVGVPRSGTTWVQRMLAAHPEAWPLLETYMFSRQIGLGALLRSMPAAEPQTDSLDLPPPGLGRIFAREELVGRAAGDRRALAAARVRRGLAVRDREEPLAPLRARSDRRGAARGALRPCRPRRPRRLRVAGRGAQVVVALRRLAGEQHRRARRRDCGRRRSRAASWPARSSTSGCSSFDTRRPEPTRRRRAGGCSSIAGCRMTRCWSIAPSRRPSSAARRARGEDQALRAGRVGDWRRRFGMRDAWSFERLAGDALRETGYEPDPRWWMRRPLRSRL